LGKTFCDHIYSQARERRIQFGEALFEAFDANFPEAPRSFARVTVLMRAVIGWLDAHPLPHETPEDGWGHWMIAAVGGDTVPAPSADCVALLHALDDLIEEDQTSVAISRQIIPLGKDRALAESQGVRIMTMGGAKGLTVRAKIVVGLEEGIVPRPEGDLGEERRLLYVAMTRAKEFLYCTWARRRLGPTARAGTPRIQDRRNYTSFLRGGPVSSRDGQGYLEFGVRPGNR